MKKVFLFFAIAALACTTACQREVLPEAEIPETEGKITFTSVKPVLENETPTRTEWTGETIQWSAGDQIRMAYTVNGVWQGASDESTDPKLYASDKLKEATDVAEFSVSANFKSTAAGSHVFYGLYPGSLTGSSTSFNNAPVADVNIPTKQTPAADSFDSAADVMIGVSEELAQRPAEEETVLMSWTRLVAHADLTIKNLTINEGETIENITLTAQDDADLVGMHSINLVTGDISNAQGATNEIVITAENLTYANKTIKVWASMLPATLTELTVTVETDKAFYVRSFTGITREFKKNMRNTMNIGMTSAVRTEKASNLEDYEESFSGTLGEFTIEKQVLSDGLTYVWAKNNSYAKASAYVSGKAYAATSYLVSPALTIGSDKSKLTFEHAANFLNGKAFDDNFYVVVFDGDTEEVLSLDVKPNGSSWTFVNSSVSLSKYNGKAIKIGFKYTSTDQLAGTWEVKNFKVTDVKGAEAPVLESIAISDVKTTDFYVDDTFRFDGKVMATYNDESTKDVTANVEISTPDMSTAGNKTITISYTEGEVTKTATYEITVNEKPTGLVTLYSEDFGTTGSKTAVADYTGWSWTGSNHPDGWKVSANSVSGLNSSEDAYAGASGACNLYSGTANESAKIAFGNVSSYSTVTLSFGWANAAGKGKTRTLKVEVSGDGGENWDAITFTTDSNATTNDGFHHFTYEVPSNYLNDFAVKFTNTSTNTSRIDDVLLVGNN